MILLEMEKERESLYRKRKGEVWLVVIVSLLYLTFLSLSIALSGDDYSLMMWIDIALGCLFVWWLLYFLTVKMKETGAYLRFYMSEERGLVSVDTIEVIDYSKDLVDKDGMESFLLKGRFQEEGKTYERDFYVIKGDPLFQKGEIIKVTSFSNVILSYEVMP